jgi:hypothetical protein
MGELVSSQVARRPLMVHMSADRLASPRARRAAAARDIKSAGTASPVPKYISSGVTLAKTPPG